MKTKEIIETARGLAKPFRISKGKDFRLKDVDPNNTLEYTREADKPRAKEALAMGVMALAELQDKLYAQDKWAVLLIFQAMDAAGKDGAIKHVMSGVNPQGCQVYSFKSPSSEDLDHDYLWRCMKCLPNRGHIGIFNRSYYEEVLVVRVHPEFLARQKLPPRLVGKNIWDERFEDIRNFEQYLARNGVVVRKFFLHVSKKEQKRRFLERIDDPQKNWKFSSNDAAERDFWVDFSAYASQGKPEVIDEIVFPSTVKVMETFGQLFGRPRVLDLPIDEAGLNAWIERHTDDPLQAVRGWVAQYKVRHRKDTGG
jgi:PPK2 family polyphosphate:nucleotide phosphotransferase